jgi:hypothetical protein
MNWVKFIPPCSACRDIKRIENCRIDKILIFKTKPGPYSNCPREQTKEKSAYSSLRRFFTFIFSRSHAMVWKEGYRTVGHGMQDSSFRSFFRFIFSRSLAIMGTGLREIGLKWEGATTISSKSFFRFIFSRSLAMDGTEGHRMVGHGMEDSSSRRFFRFIFSRPIASSKRVLRFIIC